MSLVWTMAAVGLAATVASAHVGSTFAVRHVLDARRHCALAGAAACAVFALAAKGAAPSIPSGDEPRYLVITQSLLYDHDLQIQNNLARGDYRAYFAQDLGPDFYRRGRNGAIYSIHAPGLPAVVLPAFALGGYRAVVAFLVVVAAGGCALAWWLAWRTTGDLAAAWFGWAAVALSAPFLLEAFTVYPDGLGATVVLTGVWALFRAEWERERGAHAWWPWLCHGAALALLPWLHTRLAVVAATLGGLILIRLARTTNPVAKAIAFLAVPAVSALAWLFFFVIVYGTPDLPHRTPASRRTRLRFCRTASEACCSIRASDCLLRLPCSLPPSPDSRARGGLPSSGSSWPCRTEWSSRRLRCGGRGGARRPDSSCRSSSRSRSLRPAPGLARDRVGRV